jgi:hypothetical protein
MASALRLREVSAECGKEGPRERYVRFPTYVGPLGPERSRNVQRHLGLELTLIDISVVFVLWLTRSQPNNDPIASRAAAAAPVGSVLLDPSRGRDRSVKLI